MQQLPMERLPLDVTSDILSRLTVKSLLRLRCVSKSFCSLIDSQEFIKLYLNRSIETNSNLSLILSGTPNPIRTSSNFWMRRIFSASLDSLDTAVKLDHPFQKTEVEIIGSCNGLIASKNLEGDVALWNPSTKKHLMLPTFCSHIKGYHNDQGFRQDFVADGFGYDAASDDYKLVRIIRFYKRGFEYHEVTVYSLKTNSSRRFKDFPYYFAHSRDAAFVAGALHWVVALTPNRDQEELIVAFDLKTEEFYPVPLPPLNKKNEVYIVCVDAVRGCLCLTCLCEYPRSCDTWIMKDCGMQKSWEILFTIPRVRVIGLCDYIKVLAYAKSGNTVLVDKFLYGEDYDKDKWTLHWYDVGNKRAGSALKIRGVPRGARDTVICLDSLVSLRAYSGMDV